jgi:hypothetical protein
VISLVPLALFLVGCSDYTIAPPEVEEGTEVPIDTGRTERPPDTETSPPHTYSADVDLTPVLPDPPPPDCRETFISDALLSVNTLDDKVYTISIETGEATVVSEIVGLSDLVFITSSTLDSSGAAIASDSQNRMLWKLDPCTGAMSAIGPTGAGSACGLSWGPGGGLYALDTGDQNLIRLDPETGAATVVGPLNTLLDTCGLAYDCLRDTLVGANSRDGQIFDVDAYTGAISNVRETGVFFDSVGLEYDPTRGVFFASSGNELYSLDGVTGKGTLIGTIEGVSSINNLAYDPTGLLCN